MKEAGIIMSSPMVKALLAGSKTQTRRILDVSKIGPSIWSQDSIERIAPDRDLFQAKTVKYNVWSNLFACPYGVAGDRLWVRETAIYNFLEKKKEYVKHFKADGYERTDAESWTPSIYMPRWASRITLEITRVRVERVHDISEKDAKAEGVTFFPIVSHATGYRSAYRQLWDSILGAGAWELNPWVWVLEFKKI